MSCGGRRFLRSFVACIEDVSLPAFDRRAFVIGVRRMCFRKRGERMSSKEVMVKTRSWSKGVVIVGAIMLVCLASAVCGSIGLGAFGGERGRVAIIHDGEGGIREVPLDRDGTLEVTTSLGSNAIMVEDGCVLVADADCAGRDCVSQGPISYSGERIVCLPHRLWIEVSGKEEGQGGRGFDVVSR